MIKVKFIDNKLEDLIGEDNNLQEIANFLTDNLSLFKHSEYHVHEIKSRTYTILCDKSDNNYEFFITDSTANAQMLQDTINQISSQSIVAAKEKLKDEVNYMRHIINNALTICVGNITMILKKSEDEAVNRRLNKVVDKLFVSSNYLELRSKLLNDEMGKDIESICNIIKDIYSEKLKLNEIDFNINIQENFEIEDIMSINYAINEVFINALEALIMSEQEKKFINLDASNKSGKQIIVIENNGPKLIKTNVDLLFKEGFTNKTASSTGNSLVEIYNILEEKGNSISFNQDDNVSFKIEITQ